MTQMYGTEVPVHIRFSTPLKGKWWWTLQTQKHALILLVPLGICSACPNKCVINSTLWLSRLRQCDAKAPLTISTEIKAGIWLLAILWVCTEAEADTGNWRSTTWSSLSLFVTRAPLGLFGICCWEIPWDQSANMACLHALQLRHQCMLMHK